MNDTLRAAALDAESREPVFELAPAPPPRVVGPGRRERQYQQRVAALERDVELRAQELALRAQEVALRDQELALRTRELEVSALVERGAVRAATKLEHKLADAGAAAEKLQQAQNRLLVALGALQRENELLRDRLALATAPRGALAARTARPAP
jgi:hypothetical protein